ncbi:MAG: hypothetical protein LHW64_02660 [Candidatus Cloacimonetes bacterium]|nr:hypothetical protein [Candidatus Cloacimonadota bacterium]MCB5286690.1 hypothetical protein [Candidatus Cloacimonadota bacterium]MCK9184784.1 hypothetical protein [Candidatus Cloacimonadota bacterium]MCK9584536.1 hypothetical protein [Candidatus Cloacimonadota bacterium]MDY0229010.1 hypothetical protein [Candidatus Cloacimonadaceae bacterium]
MKKLLHCLIALLLFSLAFAEDGSQKSGIRPDQDSFPSAAMPAVRASLAQFLAQIPPHSMADYGFANIEEIDQAWAAEPLKLYELDPQKVLDYIPGSSLGDLLRQSREWFVPVRAGAGIKAMLRLEEDQDGELQGVSFGYVPLAGQIQQALAKPELRGYGQPALIISYQAKEFFLAFPEANTEFLYALSSDEAQAKTDDLDGQIARIKALISLNLQQGY